MSTWTNRPNPPVMPPLIFGERQARVGYGFHGMVDQFAHLTPKCDYDTRARNGFFFKGNVVDINGVVVNQNYYSHMLAVSPVENHNILIPLTGTHHGLWRGSKLTARQDQGFFIPANDRFQFETDVDEIAGSLIVTYDLNRLNYVLWAMTGDTRLIVSESQVRQLPLVHGAVNFRKLFLNLFSQVDSFGGNLELLMINGFDDQFYRLLAMSLRPEYFLGDEIPARDQQVIQKHEIMARFERHVEENIDKPMHLSELEAALGVTARALQYACMKRHGCSPRVYIRNRKLDMAHERLSHRADPVKLASLAFELGFSSQSQFSKYFRERFGILPSQLRG